MKRSRKDSERRRHVRARQRIKGTAERPRLAVKRSQRHIYAQIINDVAGVTLVAVTTDSKAMREEGVKVCTSLAWGKKMGVAIAEKAKEAGVTSVVFDCGGGRYHGSLKSLAEAAREGGLQF